MAGGLIPRDQTEQVADLYRKVRRLGAAGSTGGGGLSVVAMWVGLTSVDTNIGDELDPDNTSASFGPSGLFTYDSSNGKVTVETDGIYAAIGACGVLGLATGDVVQFQVACSGGIFTGGADAGGAPVFSFPLSVSSPPEGLTAGTRLWVQSSNLSGTGSPYIPAGAASLCVIKYA